MDQVHVVRHKVLVEGQSIRRVAREMGVSRNTVRRYLERPAPVRVETAPRARPVLGRVGPRLDALLAESPHWTGGKQRLTATRLHAMLVTEGFTVGITTVKEAVAEWKRRRREVFVPLVYPAGDLAEVDFFEVLVELAGARTKAWMFVMRMMHSGRDFACLYLRQDQASFLDGHVRAFEHFGCVPQRIAYDNLKAAVKKLLVGSERELAPRFEALSSHYLFEPCFCRPRTGHDKGGVESRGKAIRWQHLVPIPREATLDAARATLLARLDAAHDGERFAAERGQALPLPAHRFDPRRSLTAVVSQRSLVSVEGALYSVWCHWAGLDVTVHVGADTVDIVGPGGVTVAHPRKRFGERSIDYRHYVRELAKKPQAVRQVAAELIRDLGPPFADAWRSLVDAHGPKQAARVFAKVLGHVETRGAETVATTLSDALSRSEPLLLALAPPPAPCAIVADDALPASLRAVDVAAGRAADYDALLRSGGDS
ncbi:MAG: IS21 family transposase [Gammaproteobacteria bacterium]|nr:IS21 family transposase [Gammaproteobacteria bacterium]